MTASYLLDTHVLYRWLDDSPKLSKAHFRVLAEESRRGRPLAISSITLFELAQLAVRQRIKLADSLDLALNQIENHPLIEILHITGAVAAEIRNLGSRFPTDPVDQIIGATARVHRLKLLTSDQRIRDSGAVNVI